MLEKDLEKIEKVLKEPFIDHLPDSIIRLRRDLLLLSFIAIFYFYFRLSINQSSFFGTNIKNLNDDIVSYAFIILIAYKLINFSWIAKDHFTEWRLRLTGMQLTWVTTGVSSIEEGDYPSDPRQSTLYHWWSFEAKNMGSIKHQIKEINALIESSRAVIKMSPTPIANNLITALHGLINKSEELNRILETSMKALQSSRIPLSLKKFDSSFHSLMLSQNIRFFVIELLFPIILAVVAEYFAIDHLWNISRIFDYSTW